MDLHRLFEHPITDEPTRVGTQGSGGHWIVQVDATSTGDKVKLEVEPKACHEEGAICTYSGRAAGEQGHGGDGRSAVD